MRLVGGIVLKLICLLKTDLKSLIVYSSVAHIRVNFRGFKTITY